MLAKRPFLRTSDAKARHRWLPNSSAYSARGVSALEWRLEIVAEAFHKTRQGPGEETPQSSVRVDQIFVLSAVPKAGQVTRQLTRLVQNAQQEYTNATSGLSTHNGYLRRREFWNIAELQEQMKEGLPETLKGLLPIEFKVRSPMYTSERHKILIIRAKCYGALRMEYFCILASGSIPLDGSMSTKELGNAITRYEAHHGSIDELLDTTGKVRNLQATMSICQQGISYAWHYGSEGVALCDFASVAAIRFLPPSEMLDSSAPIEFDWYFMSRSKHALSNHYNRDPRKTGTVTLAVGIELMRAFHVIKSQLDPKDNEDPDED